MVNPFEKHSQEANRFVKTLAIRLHTPGDPEHALRVLRAVFGILRRRIVPDESLQLVSQLPLILKGVYVDGWNIMEPLSEANTLDDFVFEIRSDSQGKTYLDFANDELARKKIVTAFNALKQFNVEGELHDILYQVTGELTGIV